MREIIVDIKGGHVTVETHGFVGAACKDATRALEQAMGTTTHDEETPEFHTREVEVRNVGN